MAAHFDAMAFNWEGYEPVTKDGAADACEGSTSAGSSDGEAESAASVSAASAGGGGYGGSALAMSLLMQALNHAHCLALLPADLPWGPPARHAPAAALKWRRSWEQQWAAAPASRANLRQLKRHRVLRRAASRTPARQLGSFDFPPLPGLRRPSSLPPLSPVRLVAVSDLPSDYPPPPGLSPPGLSPPRFTLPPGLAPPCSAQSSIVAGAEGSAFDVSAFRRELVATIRELTVRGNVARAVRRVRRQAVPREHQATEFGDLLTRAAEEQFGSSRRLWWAFAVGLCAGVDAPEGSCFDMAECVAGLAMFFCEVYPSLCQEVYKCRLGVKSGLLPTLASVFPRQVLEAVLPVDLQCP